MQTIVVFCQCHLPHTSTWRKHWPRGGIAQPRNETFFANSVLQCIKIVADLRWTGGRTGSGGGHKRNIRPARVASRGAESADPFLPFYASFASERARPKLLWYYVVDTRWRDRIRRVVDDRQQLVPVRETLELKSFINVRQRSLGKWLPCTPSSERIGCLPSFLPPFLTPTKSASGDQNWFVTVAPRHERASHK